ncbi:MAG: S1 RNA-binding domain-containing protein [Vicinamibacterales bacterium]
MSVSDDDFAALFEASQQAKQYERGQTIEGTIVAIGPEVAFIDVGGKGEAVLDVAELKDADGDIEVNVGDRIQAVVVSTSGGLTLSRKLVRGAGADRQLTDAYGAGLPVEGKVEREVKGGYEVRIGRQRGFCPMSQIDIVRTTDPTVHVGRVYTFRIIEYKNDGKDLVVSRRALLEAERQAQADEARKAIVQGAVLKGRVVSVRDFGAFVDLGGGVQGLLHVSDMGWSRISKTEQFVSAGEEITVKVLRVDEDTQKISLGVKQLSEDPWLSVATNFAVGQIRTGRVTRLADFGAFVELEPGIEGLAHASTFPPTGRQDGWKGFVTAGVTATFEVLSIDADKRRIGVALIQDGVSRAVPTQKDTSGEIVTGARVTGTVDRHEPYGIFIFLAPGRTALMPMAETGVAKEGDVAKAFPVGSKVDVMVLEIDPNGRRIRVSRKAILDAQDADELREYRERSEADSSRNVGSLADQLRGALSSPRKR